MGEVIKMVEGKVFLDRETANVINSINDDEMLDVEIKGRKFVIIPKVYWDRRNIK